MDQLDGKKDKNLSARDKSNTALQSNQQVAKEMFKAKPGSKNEPASVKELSEIQKKIGCDMNAEKDTAKEKTPETTAHPNHKQDTVTLH